MDIVKTNVEANKNIVEVNPAVDGDKAEETYSLKVLNSIEYRGKNI